MSDQSIIMWLIFFMAFASAGYWHLRENNQLVQLWKNRVDSRSYEWLRRLAWSRTIQLMLVMVSAMIVITLYDWQLSEARNEIETLQQQKTKLAQSPTPPKAAVASAPAVPEQVSYYPPPPDAGTPDVVPAVTPQPEPEANVVAVPEIPAENVPVPEEEPPGKPVVLKGKNSDEQEPVDATEPTVDDVYNPEKKGKDSQSSMDEIKKRYEDILVTYMFLKKCKRVDPADYHIITSALGQEMASVNAPGRMQYDIMTSAQGSYKEMYAQSRCDGASINALQAQYTNYIKTLSDNSQMQ